MREIEARDEENTIRRLRRRLWVERSLLLALVVGALIVAGRRGADSGSVCLIAVDGHPLAVVNSPSDAERMLDAIRAAASPADREVEFAQDVTLHSVQADQNPVQDETEVLAILASELRLMVEATAVLADDEVVFSLPSQREAVEALSLLLSEFSPSGGEVTAAFKERIRVEPRSAFVRTYFASPAEAVASIKAGARAGEDHVVKRGETAWGLARRFGIPLNRLAQANPDVDLDRLQADETLTLPLARPPITVVARQEVREQVGEGPNRRTRALRITYENGVEVRREVIGRSRTPALISPGSRRTEDSPYRWRDEIPQ